ncbi:hypothetical protein BpHYR1_009193 [Brachionus plicatilis]|uniref:Uncharacterized protein n=1 Tax=Brachionus plicatilis TaxID=10195 RepID=A0A3M7PE40_BRAPC|nr:hypothetical protein BpHYR1_009193 [Brachionus plicatilis]
MYCFYQYSINKSLNVFNHKKKYSTNYPRQKKLNLLCFSIELIFRAFSLLIFQIGYNFMSNSTFCTLIPY